MTPRCSTARLLFVAGLLTGCATPQRPAAFTPPPTQEASPEEPRPSQTQAEQRRLLLDRFLASYVPREGGFRESSRLLEAGSTELAILAGSRGLSNCEGMAQRTLLNSLKLIDRVWGGIYDHRRGTGRAPWLAKTYSKELRYQAEAMQMYAYASAMWGTREYLEAAQSIDDYVQRFLTSPEGTFYAGQEAISTNEIAPADYHQMDDEERRRHGIPAIREAVLTRDNAKMIVALTTYYGVSGRQAALDRAVAAARWMVLHRRNAEGGYRQTDDLRAAPELADSLAMGQAALALYATTGDADWLGEAEDTAQYVIRTFSDDELGGFVTTISGLNDDAHDVNLNVEVARFTNLLGRYTGRPLYAQAAAHAMVFLYEASATGRYDLIPGLLIADYELRRDPVHIIVVGDRHDPRAQQLHNAALAHPTPYRVVEWVEPGPAPLRHPFMPFPRPNHAAAIACAHGDCAPPAYEVDVVHAQLADLVHH